jgi:hypothetical protein
VKVRNDRSTSAAAGRSEFGDELQALCFMARAGAQRLTA